MNSTQSIPSNQVGDDQAEGPADPDGELSEQQLEQVAGGARRRAMGGEEDLESLEVER